MGTGRIGMILLALAVAGGAWAATALTGDDRPSTTGALLQEKARQEDPAGVRDVAEDDDAAPGGPDATGDARDHTGTRAEAGGLSDVALDATDGVTTTGDVADRLRGELATERAASDALWTRVGKLTRTSAALRSQLARSAPRPAMTASARRAQPLRRPRPAGAGAGAETRTPTPTAVARMTPDAPRRAGRVGPPSAGPPVRSL